ncbi:SseB family protein [Phycicoccus sp. CSK15P-2]|uniref:SseB family protein n=1 Tax=Phycicoccus sp. CSK15P-2 TaxID=2807627 RepID=UPI00194F1850|nr:SseB family protein [Phycicoccus sp. CSK15P-2]MBM6403677.1 SseB family protein [Phycicoccus sp. CSK15P-2]
MPSDQPHPSREATDSAGTPWVARDLSASGFETDTGDADPVLAAALSAGPDDLGLMRAVEQARLVVPVVAEPGGVDASGGPAVEKSADMAVVTLVAPDGRRALPVFTGTSSLAAWDPGARPVPVTAARAAQAAVSEGCDVLVLDVAGPATVVLRPSMLWALAQQRPWEPAHTDAVVARGVTAAVAREADVVDHAIEEGTPEGEGVLGIVLRLRPGLAPEHVREVATRVGERLATDGELRARVDGLAFRIV